MLHLSASRCSFIAILLVSLVSFASITLCVASQRAFIVVSMYFVIDSVRKLLDPHSYSQLPPTAQDSWGFFHCITNIFSCFGNTSSHHYDGQTEYNFASTFRATNRILITGRCYKRTEQEKKKKNMECSTVRQSSNVRKVSGSKLAVVTGCTITIHSVVAKFWNNVLK
jgi:hypothetical protein